MGKGGIDDVFEYVFRGEMLLLVLSKRTGRVER
jgi:hypothetical protein